MHRILADKSRIIKIRRKSKFFEIVAGGLLLSACLCLCGSRVTASNIFTFNPGDQNKTALGSGFPVGGSIVAAETNGFLATSGGLTIQGTVTSLVIRGDSLNEYGGLTFEYLLAESSGPGINDQVGGMTAGSFAGFQTDISFNTNGSGVIAPTTFSRSSALNSGATLTFTWGNEISPGQVGDMIVVQTGASLFGTGSGSVFDTAAQSNVGLLVPVPEPQIAGLAAMGLCALFVFRRRKSK